MADMSIGGNGAPINQQDSLAALGRRLRQLQTDVTTLGPARRSSDANVDAAYQAHIEGLLRVRLSEVPLDRLRETGPAGLRLKPLEQAGFTNVGQVAAVPPAALTNYRGVGAQSAQQITSAAAAIRATTWQSLLTNPPDLATDPSAVGVRAAVSHAHALRSAEHALGPLLPALRSFASEGVKAATMSSRTFTSQRRKAAAQAALQACGPVLGALDREGISALLARALRTETSQLGELGDHAGILQVLHDRGYPNIAPYGAPAELGLWEARRASGSIPAVRVTHPGVGVAASAAAVLLIGGIAAGGGSAEPEAAPATPQQPSSISSPSPTEPAEPSVSPTPTFTLEAARLANAESELADRRAWEVAYAAATAAAPSSGSIAAVGASGTAVIAYVVDGDTVILESGDRVRLIGIDTPEYGECGFTESSAFAEELLLNAEVTLTEVVGEPASDQYGRQLRYITLADGRDYGLASIQAGFAAARYDSLDGYAPHPQQDAYHASDDSTAHLCGDENPARSYVPPAPEPVAPAPIAASTGRPEENEPWNQPGPDLDCKDIGHRVIVYSPDYHKLDRDGDGIGCESW